MESPAKLFELLQAIGLPGAAAAAVIFAGLWWLERKDRKACEREKSALQREVITAVKDSTAAFNLLVMRLGQ